MRNSGKIPPLAVACDFEKHFMLFIQDLRLVSHNGIHTWNPQHTVIRVSVTVITTRDISTVLNHSEKFPNTDHSNQTEIDLATS